MRSTVIQKFINRVNTVVVNNGVETIKDTIGDSLDNHRVPSVSQLVRFLTLSRSTQYRSLARKLYSLHTLFGNNSRKLGSRRTDAVDVTELLSYLNAINYHADVETKQVVTRIING